MTTIPLNGSWTFRATALRGAAPRDAGLTKWLPATMPGTIHFQLQRLGIIADPFIGRNELAVQWIDEQDWELRHEFTATDADCAQPRQELICEGIDTVCTVQLNGREIGASVNMFRQLCLDVREALRPGDNVLLVKILSPTAWSAAAADQGGHRVPDGDFKWQTGEVRPAQRAWIRKTQCHFGWDWGCYLATSGIWLPARIECGPTPRIASVQSRQTHHGVMGAPNRVTLTVTVRLTSPMAARGSVVVILMGGEMPPDDRRDRAVISAETTLTMAAGEYTAELTLEVEKPVLWWPAGEGEQYLYYLSAHVVTDAGDRSPEIQHRIGLRTCELVTTDDKSPEGKPGQSFYFRINGRDIYARGANWIPADQFVDRCLPPVYRHLLTSMVQTNMNMVRVWGGGWYELDVFYNLCDELGILVWQDFMMACAMYPDSPEFLGELRAEAKEQVRRLADHPAIALWCGDNENNESAVHWMKNRPDHAALKDIYRTVMGALQKVVEAEDPSRRFWVSSPSNGVIDDNPSDPNKGDVHYWTVWHGRQPFSNYYTVKPRFASEFGFQSFPEPRTISAVVPAAELNPSSRVMEHHQRSNDGNMLITNTMAREMRIPKDFPSFCWVSQINQAMAIRTAVEHWRRLKPWCMGTIYWQINDLWPVASWSSIDYHGRWKVLHHAAQRFYAPLLASMVHESGKLVLWATSDLPHELALRGELEVVTWAGERVRRIAVSGTLPALGSAAIATVEVADLLKTPKGKPAIEAHEVCCFLRLSAKADGRTVSADNFSALVPWKWVTLPTPKYKVKLQAQQGGNQPTVAKRGVRSVAPPLELVVTTTSVVPFFHAELADEEGHFSGDWQVLAPGKTYVLPWVPHSDRGGKTPALAAAKAKLGVLSLADTY